MHDHNDPTKILGGLKFPEWKIEPVATLGQFTVSRDSKAVCTVMDVKDVGTIAVAHELMCIATMFAHRHSLSHPAYNFPADQLESMDCYIAECYARVAAKVREINKQLTGKEDISEVGCGAGEKCA